MAAAISTVPAAAATAQEVAHHSIRSGPGCAAEGGGHVPAESARPGRHAGYTEPHERCASQCKSPHTEKYQTSRQSRGQVAAMHFNCPEKDMLHPVSCFACQLWCLTVI